MNKMYQEHWDALDRQARAELSREEQHLVARIEGESAGATTSTLRKLAEFPIRNGFMLSF